MKSRGGKRKINNASTQDFSSALLPGAVGDCASPGVFKKEAARPGRSRSPPPLPAGQLLSSILLCPSPLRPSLREPLALPKAGRGAGFRSLAVGWLLLSASSLVSFGA